MTDFVTGETFQTIMGGVIVLFLIAPAIKMGPLRFLGEMLANLVFKVLFLAVAFGILIVFARTDIGEALGGVGTALVVIFALPFLWLIGVGIHVWFRRRSKADVENAGSDR